MRFPLFIWCTNKGRLKVPCTSFFGIRKRNLVHSFEAGGLSSLQNGPSTSQYTRMNFTRCLNTPFFCACTYIFRCRSHNIKGINIHIILVFTIIVLTLSLCNVVKRSDLAHSFDDSPYTQRNLQKAKWV